MCPFHEMLAVGAIVIYEKLIRDIQAGVPGAKEAAKNVLHRYIETLDPQQLIGGIGALIEDCKKVLEKNTPQEPTNPSTPGPQPSVN